MYDTAAVALDSIYDSQIGPDKGSASSFERASTKYGGRYTVTVDFSPKPAHPAANTLYSPPSTPQGVPDPDGVLMYRVYVPLNPANLEGDVPLPQVTIEGGGADVVRGACSTDPPDTGDQLNDAIAGSSYPASVPRPPIPGAHNPPTWSRAYGNEVYGLFGNDQNAYLTAGISRQYGDLVVIHGRAPTFRNTRAGQSVVGHYQLRYWSICENSITTRVVACAADADAALRDGYYTYVISDPDVRPSNASAADGVTWLPWGGTFPDGVVIYRNMLPSAAFTAAVQEIGRGQSPQHIMGPYYPQIVYCAPATFQEGGWAACQRQSAGSATSRSLPRSRDGAARHTIHADDRPGARRPPHRLGDRDQAGVHRR